MSRPRSCLAVLLACTAVVGLATGAGSEETENKETKDPLALSEEPIPFLLEEDLPKRTGPILELGPGMLDSGKIPRGIELPTGAVWNPSLWVFGSYRTSINYLDPWQEEDQKLVEWPHRLDLFANLQLTGTERLLVGFQPLHQEGRFTNFTFRPDSIDGWTWEANYKISTLFFEGELGEIFPKLDPEDRKGLDIGFAVGRQKIEFQDGIMVNDFMDSIGITRNSLTLPGVSNLRTTFLFAWDNIHRDNNRRDDKALLFGVFTEMDTRRSSIEIDLAYVSSCAQDGFGGDGIYLGVGAVQRFGFINTTFRVNGSHALDEENDSVSDGVLLFAELSTSPRGTHDALYVNGFWGIDSYASAARDPTTGGPLGRTGLLFAAVGLGRFRPALGNRADESYGAALGYQRFWDSDKTQLILEAGGRRSTADGPDAWAIGARLQRKLGRRYLLQLDSYLTEPDDAPSVIGLRTELQVKF